MDQCDHGRRDSAGSGPGIEFAVAIVEFPVFTGEQVYLGVEAVNMLAQLSAWNVQQLSGAIASWLGS